MDSNLTGDMSNKEKKSYTILQLLDKYTPESLKDLLTELTQRCNEECNRLWGSGRKQNCKIEKCSITLQNIFKQIPPSFGPNFTAQVYEKLQIGDVYIWKYFLEYLLSEFYQFMNLMRENKITMSRRLRNVADIVGIRNEVFIQFCFHLQEKIGKPMQLNEKGALNEFLLGQIKKIFKETQKDTLITAIYEKYGRNIFNLRADLQKILDDNKKILDTDLDIDNLLKNTLFKFLCIILGYDGCQQNNSGVTKDDKLMKRLQKSNVLINVLSFYEYANEILHSYYGTNLHTFCNNVLGLSTEEAELLDAYVGGRIKTKNRQRCLKRNKRTRRFNKY